MIADILEHLACRADVDIGTVCFTNEDGTPSYENGLFASGRSIARGTFIGFYTGEWLPFDPDKPCRLSKNRWHSMVVDDHVIVPPKRGLDGGRHPIAMVNEPIFGEVANCKFIRFYSTKDVWHAERPERPASKRCDAVSSHELRYAC